MEWNKKIFFSCLAAIFIKAFFRKELKKSFIPSVCRWMQICSSFFIIPQIIMIMMPCDRYTSQIIQIVFLLTLVISDWNNFGDLCEVRLKNFSGTSFLYLHQNSITIIKLVEQVSCNIHPSKPNFTEKINSCYDDF